jgi:hypothetical protein
MGNNLLKRERWQQCHGLDTALPCRWSVCGFTPPGLSVALAIFLAMTLRAASCEPLDNRAEPVSGLVVLPSGDVRTEQKGSFAPAAFRLLVDAVPKEQLAPFNAISNGTSVAEIAVTGAKDRWGNKPAQIALRNDAGSIAIWPDDLIASGIGAVWPADEEDHPCLDRLFALESDAIAEKRGFWAEPSAIIAQPSDIHEHRDSRASFVKARIDRLVLLRNVAFLNLGREWQGKLSISAVLPKGKAERSAMLDALQNLVGRKVLIRGIIEAGANGRKISITNASHIRAEDEVSQ